MSGALDNVDRLVAEGEELADAERPDEALARFRAAWEALPEPKGEQEPAVKILAAIADCCFFLGRWADCRDAVQHALQCGGDVSNPFVRLRLGQSLYELGDVRESANWLVPVYLMGLRLRGRKAKGSGVIDSPTKTPDPLASTPPTKTPDPLASTP